MSAPLVTIVTATYNRPSMFAECAAAVLAQKFADWQWWVVMNDVEYPPDYKWKPFEDPRVVPVFFPLPYGDRHERYVPAQIINWLYPKVTTPYIYWLSDDDLIDPDGLQALVAAMDQDYEWKHDDNLGFDLGHRFSAVYGRCEVVDQQPDGSYKHGAWCYDAGDVGLGTGINPNCLLDGGQVLHTSALWRRATAEYDCPVCRGSGAMNSPSLQWIATCTHCGGGGQVRWQLSDKPADAGACDGLLLQRLAEFARFHYVPQRIVTHRRHAGATCHKPQLL